jgi:hypothetical protein
MNFARWTFWIAGWYGLAVILPQYFLERRISLDYPPAITHPEHFYGFISVALAWQVAFLIMSRDPLRYRPLMPAGVLEKASFGIAALVLYFQNRLTIALVPFALLDLVLGVLFLEAYRRTGNASRLKNASGGTL